MSSEFLRHSCNYVGNNQILQVYECRVVKSMSMYIFVDSIIRVDGFLCRWLFANLKSGSCWNWRKLFGFQHYHFIIATLSLVWSSIFLFLSAFLTFLLCYNIRVKWHFLRHITVLSIAGELFPNFFSFYFTETTKTLKWMIVIAPCCYCSK